MFDVLFHSGFLFQTERPVCIGVDEDVGFSKDTDSGSDEVGGVNGIALFPGELSDMDMMLWDMITS